MYEVSECNDADDTNDDCNDYVFNGDFYDDTNGYDIFLIYF